MYLKTVDPKSPVYWSQPLEKEWPLLNDLRTDEINLIEYKAQDGTDFIAGYSDLKSLQLQSTINIIRTIFLCIVLGVSSVYFTKDAQDMVLDPLERMIEKVKVIASNPMSAATDEVDLAGIYSFAASDDKK